MASSTSIIRTLFFMLISLSTILVLLTFLFWNNSIMISITYQQYAPRQLSLYISDNGTARIEKKTLPQKNKTKPVPHHTLALLLPYRDCEKELHRFAPHMFHYLNEMGIKHKIYVLNQVDSFRFNRAFLVNVGFREMDKDCDYIAIHDIDLLPLTKELDYGYPEKGPMHLAAPWLHPDHNKSPRYCGGILLMTRRQFQKVNGMSNNYWGWGREDDDLLNRIRRNKMKFLHPNVTTSYNDTFIHIHNTTERPRDKDKYFNQVKFSKIFDKESGLRNMKYTVKSKKRTKIGQVPITRIDVELTCNVTFTPFCLQKKDHNVTVEKG